MKHACNIPGILISYCICFLLLWPGDGRGQESAPEVTPTDVYYTAKAIDASLSAAHGLISDFNRKRISNNIRPRNSYQKLLSVADEFNFLYNNAIDPARLEEARNVDALNTGPAELFHVLLLIREVLVAKNQFIPWAGQRIPKTPSDVTQMLRQISSHLVELALKRGLDTDWASAAYVYDAIVKDLLPGVQAAADEAGLRYEPFAFPRQPVRDVIPLNTLRLLQRIYYNISRFYSQKLTYFPLLLIPVNDCDEVTAADVFDLIKAVSAEIKAMGGSISPSPEMLRQYGEWRKNKSEIVPGDVFRLLQYLLVLSEQLADKNTEEAKP